MYRDSRQLKRELGELSNMVLEQQSRDGGKPPLSFDGYTRYRVRLLLR